MRTILPIWCAGVVMSTFLSSVIALMTAMTDNVKLRNITLWLLGDLSSGAVEGLLFVISRPRPARRSWSRSREP